MRLPWIGTISQQIADLSANFLDRVEENKRIQEQVAEIDSERNSLDDSALQGDLKQIEQDRQKLGDELTKVLQLAIEQAKIDKIVRDLDFSSK